MSKMKTWQKIIFFIGVAALIVFCVFDLAKIKILQDETSSRMLVGACLRISGAVCVLVVIGLFNYKRLNFGKLTPLSLILILPAVAIALNNFPFIDFFGGKLKVTQPDLIWLFLLECISVGLFEELIFRGIIFMFILEKKCNSKKQIFISIIISSALFGLVHIVNLFAGAGIGSVALQIGYSFLIGALMCFVLLITKNIFVCAFTHALYNFCGLFFETLGQGNIWSIPTIILTATVAVAVVAYCMLIFVSKKYILPQNIKPLFKLDAPKNNNEEETT